MKLVDHYNLNTINPFNNPELRFSKKFVDCCEKSNIAYTDNKIKSFIASRVKYQLRADYPEESKESDSNKIQINQTEKTEFAVNNNNYNELIMNENLQMQNQNFYSNTSKVNNPITPSGSNFNNLKSFGDLAAINFNTSKSENANILSEINNQQIESSNSNKLMEKNVYFSANKSQIYSTKKPNTNRKNQEESKIEQTKIDNEDKQGKQFNFLNPFVHKELTNNLNTISNPNNFISKNTINKTSSGIKNIFKKFYLKLRNVFTILFLRNKKLTL